jgi:hypothetical protein
MSIYNITDITVAGAFCNAMEALRESDRRAAQRQLNSRRDAGKNESPTTILTVLRGVLRRVGRLSHYSGPRHTATAR